MYQYHLCSLLSSSRLCPHPSGVATSAVPPGESIFTRPEIDRPRNNSQAEGAPAPLQRRAGGSALGKTLFWSLHVTLFYVVRSVISFEEKSTTPEITGGRSKRKHLHDLAPITRRSTHFSHGSRLTSIVIDGPNELTC